MNIQVMEFFDVELPTERELRYSYGASTPTAQYINIHRRRDEMDLRETCKDFLNHVEIHRDNNDFQRAMYKRVFVQHDKNLPKPTKEIERKTINTIESFINGIERNFANGTTNYTVKQWEHVIDIANIAVEYFNVAHPSKYAEPLLKFKPVRWK